VHKGDTIANVQGKRCPYFGQGVDLEIPRPITTPAYLAT